jgi:hypothetical protein
MNAGASVPSSPGFLNILRSKIIKSTGKLRLSVVSNLDPVILLAGRIVSSLLQESIGGFITPVGFTPLSYTLFLMTFTRN